MLSELPNERDLIFFTTLTYFQFRITGCDASDLILWVLRTDIILTLSGVYIIGIIHISYTPQLRELKRDKIEDGLTFEGFVIVSCPLKRDSLDVITEIQESSHIVSKDISHF